MAKLAIVFFAALAFQAVLAHSHHNQQQQTHEVQALLAQVRSMSAEAATSVHTIHVETDHGKRSVISQAKEYAHDIHEVVHHLNHAIQHNHGGAGQHELQQVVQHLSDIVHSIELALHGEPTHVRDQLKTHVEAVVAQAEKLAQVAQQQQKTHDVNDEVQDVLDELLVAVQKVHVRNQVEAKNHQEIKSQIQAVTTQVSSAIQGVSFNDVHTVHDLVHHAHHLAHHVGEIVYELQHEVHHHDGDVKNVIEQVVGKLAETRAHLEEVDDQTQVGELKTQLKTNVHNVAVQIERLVQLAHDEQELHDVRTVVEVVLVDALVAARQLQRELEVVAHNNQH